MSKKLFLFPALLLGAMLMFAPACGESDPCKDVDCGVNGTCFEGGCVCNEGFEGSACADEWATKFLGTYTGSDNCGGALTKPVAVTRLSGTSIRVSNFGGFDSYLDVNIKKATAGADTADLIEFTNATDPSGRKFTGTGTLSGNSLSVNYTVTYSDGTSETCNFTVVK